MVLHQEFLRRGMLDTHVQLVINVMEKSLLLEKLPVCLKQQTRGTACRCFAIW
jgi:hypothetical protein